MQRENRARKRVEKNSSSISKSSPVDEDEPSDDHLRHLGKMIQGTLGEPD